ncbi:LysR substrate-binding domain-containing protein [Leifsonia sp. WHRI 6310E]|uniref:LysR substrate-binding domain-containing protein n=1 Tax=Leifsonia sp. WHRI 6310E TaxID=3162562 RepID=UPI0032EE3C6C
MSIRVDIDTLRLLTEIGRSGSLSAAARENGVSQQAVSARMASLEREIGITLLHRTPQGTSLTEAGVLVTEWALPLLEAAARFTWAATTLRSTASTSLRIASSLTIAEHLAPDWIVALRTADTALRIELIALNSATVAESVRAGKVDIGFIETPDIPDDLAFTNFATDELIVVVGATHPWANRRSGVTVAELASTPALSRERGSGTRLAFERALTEAGHPPVDPAAELSTAGAIRSTAAAGQAPAVLSILAVREQLATGVLRRVSLRGLRIVRPLTAIWRGDRVTSAVQRVLDVLAGR